jgi:hypothetical protein
MRFYPSRHTLWATLIAVSLRPGCGLAAGLETLPTVKDKLAFGSHEVGTQSDPLALVITNPASSTVRVSVRRPTLADYIVERDDCKLELASGKGCNVDIGFTPAEEGERKGIVLVDVFAVNQAKVGTLSVTLIGRGQLPPLGIGSNRVFFPVQRVGTSSAPSSVTLTNNTDKDILIDSIATTEEFFVEPSLFPQVIRTHAALSVPVSFRPTHDGVRAGLLSIMCSPAVSQRHVRLLGNAETSPPIASSRRGANLEIVVVLALCGFYWLAMVIIRWNRVARPAREWLRAEIASVRTELATLNDTSPDGSIRHVEGLLEEARHLIDGSRKESGSGLLNVLFWSRGQEMTGWAYAHQAEVQMARVQPHAVVTAMLESEEQRLRGKGDAPSLALANSIHVAVTGTTVTHIDRRRALLAEALSLTFEHDDNSYADLVSWQNKASWLVGCGLALMCMLAVALPDQSILFLLGGAGGLLSRMSRSLARNDVPTDYGASWTTLFLSPVAGALGAWAGVLLCGLAIQLHVLGPAFAIKWDDSHQPETLAIALLFGFSERLLDGILTKLEGGASAVDGSGKTVRLAQGTAQVESRTLQNANKLPDGTVGVHYSSDLSAIGAVAAGKWFLSAGASLPEGLKVDESGRLTGVPSKAGTFTVSVDVVGKVGVLQQEFNVTIIQAP